MRTDERGILRIIRTLDHNRSTASVIAHEYILGVSLSRIVTILNPLLANELELTPDTCIQCNENEAVFVLVANRLIFRHIFASMIRDDLAMISPS